MPNAIITFLQSWVATVRNDLVAMTFASWRKQHVKQARSANDVEILAGYLRYCDGYVREALRGAPRSYWRRLS